MLLEIKEMFSGDARSIRKHQKYPKGELESIVKERLRSSQQDEERVPEKNKKDSLK